MVGPHPDPDTSYETLPGSLDVNQQDKKQEPEGGHSRKEPFEQLVNTLYGVSTYVLATGMSIKK